MLPTSGSPPPHRRFLHQRIAAALEQRHADNAAAAQIAEQYERGGLPDQAIHFHALAADADAEVFAYKDAVGHFERALELLADLPASVARDQRELALCEAMVPPLLALSGYAAPRLGALLERMTELSVRLDDPDRAQSGGLVGAPGRPGADPRVRGTD